VCAAFGDASTAAAWVDKIAAERQIWTVPLIRSRMMATALAGPHFDALSHAICRRGIGLRTRRGTRDG
jgi:hypothetical protein